MLDVVDDVIGLAAVELEAPEAEVIDLAVVELEPPDVIVLAEVIDLAVDVADGAVNFVPPDESLGIGGATGIPLVPRATGAELFEAPPDGRVTPRRAAKLPVAGVCVAAGAS